MGGSLDTLSVRTAHHYARLYAGARAACISELRRAGCGEDEAEEIFAATLERIMGRLDPPAEGFGRAQTVALLRRACRQALIDEHRHREALPVLPLIEAVALPDRTSQGPAEVAEDHEAVEVGREAIAALPERDRALFRERHELGLDPEEILRRNPGLSRRTYRKVMQRANARALDAYEEISGGERCAALRRDLLRRYVAGEAAEGDARVVRAHLCRCRSCGLEAARMRGHLHGVATGLAALLASPGLRGGAPGRGAERLLELLGGWGDGLGAATRAARERLREAVLRVASGLPGPAGEGAAGQVAGIAGAKAASACAAGAIAAGCLAAGFVPGVGGIELAEGQREASRVPAGARAVERSSPAPAQRAAPPGQTRGSEVTPGAARDGGESPTAPGAKARKPAAVQVEPTVSGRQTGAEFGAEAEGTGTPVVPSAVGAPPESTKGEGGSSRSGAGGGSHGASAVSSEFGL